MLFAMSQRRIVRLVVLDTYASLKPIPPTAYLKNNLSIVAFLLFVLRLMIDAEIHFCRSFSF